MNNLKEKKKHFFFLIGGVFIEPTAIEIQACIRARLFKKIFDVMPTIITHGYEHNLRNNLKIHCEAKKYEEIMPIFSLYELYCDKTKLAEKENDQSFNWQSNLRYEVDKHNLNNYWVFRDEKLEMFIEYHPYTRKINYINYIDSSDGKIKIIKRDFYDEQGYLSQVGVVDSETKGEEVKYLLDRQGRQRLAIHYKLINGRQEIVKIYVYNENGMVTKIFNSHKELVEDALQKIANLYPDDELYFFIEHSIYYSALRKLKHSNMKVISIFHDIHTISPEVKNAPFHIHFADALAESRINPKLTTVILTDKQKKDIEARLGTAGNLYVIPNANDYNSPLPIFENRDRFLLTAFVRLSSVKQVDKMINMFAIVKKSIPEARLEIYGVGELAFVLQKQIESLSLQDSIKLKGFIKDPYTVFEKAGLALLTSKSEAYPLVITESLSAACPFVSFDVRYGPSSMIEDGVNGFLIPPNNIEKMAEKIIYVLKDQNLHKKMSENAYLSKSKFSMETVAEKWKDLLKKI